MTEPDIERWADDGGPEPEPNPLGLEPRSADTDFLQPRSFDLRDNEDPYNCPLCNPPGMRASDVY